MVRFVPALLLSLAACASPSPEFRAASASAVVVDGREYRVWYSRNTTTGRVQVLRMGHVARGAHDGLQAAMIEAAHQASGCRVDTGSISGDTGVMTARLLCPS